VNFAHASLGIVEQKHAAQVIDAYSNRAVQVGADRGQVLPVVAEVTRACDRGDGAGAAQLARRRRSGRLARFESDRLYRLARVLALAHHSLGTPERALRWLKRSNRALGGVAPIGAIDTELGARQVENVLGRIAYGGIS
jgi:putative toxin-antitoxin system antitoxin component (TIGR02293 family)